MRRNRIPQQNVYITNRINQLKEDMARAHDEHDRNWYNRLIQEGEEEDLTLVSVNLTSIIDTNNEATPSIDFVSITLSLVIVSALRRRK